MPSPLPGSSRGSARPLADASLRNCLAPAKLNLFLHITGRRPDGYHALQTVFQLLDWGDLLHFTRRDDGVIARKTDVPGVSEAHDLVVRAARLLQSTTGSPLGVNIEIDKILPMGAGLGGGSSDAATTLLALNRLWGVDLSREALQDLALKLGADVPFFIFGHNAFAEGVGETLQAVDLPKRFFLVVSPAVHVPTAAIFSEKALTRDSKVLTITDFLAQHSSDADWPDSFGRNDMQAVVVEKYAEVAQVLEWFSHLSPARMTGSGASVFAAFRSKAEAEMAQAKLPASWKSTVTESLDSHPLFAFAS
ncbi:4-(cytidine 5'-diphospho)-2-C-methyl-D-erythritol kinase [Caballeronia mineralivorans]|jgi:4-diphosphocytidyl-2-C-methyl-D-erythritol kinase|uniref:4-(cytidine 5'-diphospho)-2-C-methyl-D-erythritol kinase n=1 Tax=Caballeronia mineralivorans TaxID=2010198 RepID=UPI0023F37E3D|nr:4-(cytidine 5'-diphospho)-2-C-methyl-D-erythritol kinase [Caballeronia mineralivorans]